MGDSVTVLKLDPWGKETWRYEGRILRSDGTSLVLEAFFNRDNRPFMGTTLKRGDRFVEFYYSDRWYNVFEIYDRDDGSFKGWYGNVSTPTIFAQDRVEYRDLYLDVWAEPSGLQTVLDEEEFHNAPLDDLTRARALRGLAALQAHLSNQKTAG